MYRICILARDFKENGFFFSLRMRKIIWCSCVGTRKPCNVLARWNYSKCPNCWTYFDILGSFLSKVNSRKYVLCLSEHGGPLQWKFGDLKILRNSFVVTDLKRKKRLTAKILYTSVRIVNLLVRRITYI